MNRETPELDHSGFFNCRDCHRGTLFGLNIDAKLMAFPYIAKRFLQRYSVG